jgi:hypothetical protein
MINFFSQVVEAFQVVTRRDQWDLSRSMRARADLELLALFADCELEISDPEKRRALEHLQIEARRLHIDGMDTFRRVLHDAIVTREVNEIDNTKAWDVYTQTTSILRQACATVSPDIAARFDARLF